MDLINDSLLLSLRIIISLLLGLSLSLSFALLGRHLVVSLFSKMATTVTKNFDQVSPI